MFFPNAARIIATNSESLALSGETPLSFPRTNPIIPLIMIVAGAHKTKAPPQSGFQTSNIIAPIPHANAPIKGPQRREAMNDAMSPICHTPRGRGIGKEMEVAIYTRAVIILVSATVLDDGTAIPTCFIAVSSCSIAASVHVILSQL